MSYNFNIKKNTCMLVKGKYCQLTDFTVGKKLYF